MKNKKPMHAGHRQRMFEMVESVGLDKFSDINKLEFFLFYIYPRGNTNDIAHRLLDKFESIDNIFNASKLELCKVEGVGKSAARKIKCFAEIDRMYNECLLADKLDLRLMSYLCDYSETLLRTTNVEELIILGLNARGKLIRKVSLAKGSINMVGIPVTTIVTFLLSTKSVYVVLVHNHPGGVAKPSPEDIKGTKFLRDVINLHGSQLLEHVIVGSDGDYGVIKDKYLRSFEIDGVNVAKL